ncbi:MAG: hypothetical protein ACE5F1_01635 [Planctomycetota bacterium]
MKFPLLPSMQRTQRASLEALLVLILLPTLLLWNALFLGEDYVPFDLTTFPPHSVALDPAELAQRHVGANYDVTEKSTICSPEYRLAREEIVEGRFPHWNPYVRAGAPLLANALDGFFYPTHWLFFVLDPDRAYGLAAWIAFCLAGLFMFGFLREIGLNVMPALFGAIVFQLSGTLAANGHFFMRMETMIWIPAGFWALERLYKQEGIRRIPPFTGFAVSLALMWFAGFPPFAVACSLAFGFYILTLGFRIWHEGGITAAGVFLLWSGAAVLLGLLVAMIQILPMLDYFPESQRELDQSVASLAGMGLDPLGWLGFLMPSPFGNPTTSQLLSYERNPLLYLFFSRSNPETGRLFFPANYNFTEYALYLGAFPVLCIILSLLKSSVRFRYFALGGLVFFLLLASGGFLFRMLAPLPPFSSIPPMRFSCMACFFGAALAGMGLQVRPGTLSILQRRILVAILCCMSLVFLALSFTAFHVLSDPSEKGEWILEWIAARFRNDYLPAEDMEVVRSYLGGERLVLAVTHFQTQALWAMFLFALCSVWVFVSPKRPVDTGVRVPVLRRILEVVAVTVTAVELLILARAVNPTFPHRDLGDTSVHRFLREQRMATRTQGGFMVARVAREPVLQDALPPNHLIPLKIRDLNAYAFLDSRSHKPFRRIYGEAQMLRGFWLKAFPADARLDRGIFDLFGVRYLLSKESLPSLGGPVIPPLEGPGGKFFVYERPTALPRAFLVPRARIEKSEEATLEHLCAELYDPLSLVLLHEEILPDPPYQELDGNGNGHPAELPFLDDPSEISQATLEFEIDNPSEVRILIRDCPGAWLVLTDTAMSHWAATLDAGPVSWWRADLCFRSVWIPPGDHRLNMSYDARPFRAGLRISSSALASILLLLAWWNGRPKKKKGDKDLVEIHTEHV